jgi:hypothetical protein
VKVWLAAAAVTAATVLLGSAASAAPQKIPYPDSMAALGDSLTVAWRPEIAANLPTNGEPDSWATGTTPAVKSHYLRILAANPRIKGKAYNLAAGGATFTEEKAQARKAIARHVEYITVWDGEDYCGVDDFSGLTKDLRGLLAVLAEGTPQPRVLFVSNRNPATMFREIRAHRSVVRKDFPNGLLMPLCGLVVGAKPAQDSKPAVVAKAAASIAKVNATIAHECARFSWCRFDGNAVYRMPLQFADLANDYDHMTQAGDRHIAEVTWRATFPFGR